MTVEPERGEVVIPQDAIRARAVAADGATLPLGEQIPVTLLEADVTTRAVVFEYRP